MRILLKMQKKDHNDDKILKEVEEFIDINQLTDDKNEIEVVLNNLNYAKVFIVLYWMEKRKETATKKKIAGASKVELTNCYRYIDYFINQGFAEFKKNPRFKKMGVVKTLPRNGDWDNLIVVALKTKRSKLKRFE